MDLENLKNTWKEENLNDIPEISTEKQKELHNPLEKIRKNMRMEFWSTVVAVIFLIIAGFYLNSFVKSSRFLILYAAFLISMIVIVGFYFIKFFKLYKEINEVTLSTKESLKDLLWNFKLNEQYYVSYYVASVPVLFFELALFSDYLPGLKEMNETTFLITFVISITVMIAFLYTFGKLWFIAYYGKHIQKVKDVLKQLEEA